MSPSTSVVEKSSLRSLPFTQQRSFRKTLNERVNAYLRENGLPARDVPAMYLKTVIALAWWLGTYLLLLLGNFPPLVERLNTAGHLDADFIMCQIASLSLAPSASPRTINASGTRRLVCQQDVPSMSASSILSFADPLNR